MTDNNPDTSTDTGTDYDDEEPLAVFEAALLPDWEWEVYEVQERDVEVVIGFDEDGDHETETTTIYFGRVKSPNTYGHWEYGTFTTNDLKTAGAFRTDEGTGEWP